MHPTNHYHPAVSRTIWTTHHRLTPVAIVVVWLAQRKFYALCRTHGKVQHKKQKQKQKQRQG